MLATTQMEATDARRAFPCWDEPDAKAVFGVTLVVPDDLLAISNAGEIGREPAGDGRVAVRFADTMPMSTYLVAFVVGPLGGHRPRSTWTASRCGSSTRRARSTWRTSRSRSAVFALRYFTEWFGMVYPGDKLDLVAIPSSRSGPWRTWAASRSARRYVLVDPATATQAELQAVVEGSSSPTSWPTCGSATW